ncbi:family 10 glycosylhydrolase [Exiguobacterium sp. s16]|uniref:family 10 glycosylhydrolase n=1 Tax=Exiguobacterium sp. s16 TaxID=2751237 RepID=UPI001BEB86D8|nr:family 10 glycosylhydrolase [Exiguobacterium sp. s16]
MSKRTMISSALSLTLIGSLLPLQSEAATKDVLKVVDASGDEMVIGGINKLANQNQLIIFNDQFSYYTETNPASTEVVLEKVGINTYTVVEKRSGNSPIPENGLVLSTGKDTTAEIKSFLQQLETGERIFLDEPVQKQEAKQANAVDPTRQTNPDGAPFDGFRGPDQLIVYTPAFGETTKTNVYGYEITVENGYVTKLGGGNSAIPKNGFVVSGHGVNSSFLSANSIIGAKVDVTNGVVTITQDVDSYAFQSEKAMEKAEQSIEQAKAEWVDVPFDLAEEALGSARALLEQANAETDPVVALDTVRQATQHAYDAYYYSIDSGVAEQRAVWHRPKESTLAGVETVLDRMERAGFNAVYLETTFWGYPIYPSAVQDKYGLPTQHPNFKNGDFGEHGTDILAAYIAEAKERGMTVHAWTDGFMVGEASLGVPSQFKNYPEWAAVQRTNTTGQPAPDTSSRYYWLDIMQPAVQEYMLELYEEMEEKYDIKGLNIDYMRLPHHGFDKAYGFSEPTRALYKDVSGIDPIDLKAGSAEWDTFQAWVRERENEFVEKLHDVSKKNDAKFMLTATPEPGAEEVYISDWKDDIDAVIPQAYGHDFNSIQKTVQASKKLMPEGTMYYTGIYSFYHHLNEGAAVDDILSAKYGTSGVNMFAFGQASAPSVDALGKGPWRDTAVNPGEEPLLAIEALLKDTRQEMNSLYIPKKGIDKQAGRALAKEIQPLERKARHGSLTTDDLNRIKEMITEMASRDDIDPKLEERLLTRVSDMQQWHQYAIDRQGFSAK